MMEGETYYLIVQSGIYPLFHHLEVSFSAVTQDGCYDPSIITGNPCILVYNPVCGCNGQTYSNDCFATEAGVANTQPGTCPNMMDNYAEPMPCGASVTAPFFGNTSNSSLSLFNSYDCQPDWLMTGPEDVYKLETDGGDFYAYVGTSGQDLDIFLLRDSGSGSLECVAYGDQVISTTIDGGIYYLVVDGYQGASGAYVLYVDCPEESANCTEVPAFTTEEIGLFSASIGWTSTEEDSLYTFQFREAGTSQWEEVICPISLIVSEGYGEPVFGSQLLGFGCPLITVISDSPIPSVSLGALKPGTAYEYRVNTTCFDNSTTDFSAIAQFATEASTDPYTTENRFSAPLSDKGIYPELLRFNGSEYEFEACINDDSCWGCGDSAGSHFEEGYEAIDDFTAQLYITGNDLFINIVPDTNYREFDLVDDYIDTVNLEGYLHIWVDHDEDLVFETSELLINSGLINSVEDFSVSFGILGGEEGLKRMRIIFNTEQDADPYGFYWSGFTLDMDVNISYSPVSCNISSDDLLCEGWVQNYLNTNYTCDAGQCGSINLYTSPAGECVVDFVGEQACLLAACPSHEVFDLDGNLLESYASECGLESLGYTNQQEVWSCGEAACPEPVDCPGDAEEILCLDWLNGIIVDLETNRCADFACTAVGGVLGFSSVKIYATETEGEVIEVYWEECLDAERRLYSCEGELLASCTGLGCEITSLGNLTFQNDIWGCTQSLPNCTSPWTPQACASGNTHFINVIYEDLESEIDGQSLEEGDWLGLFYEQDDGTLVCMDQAQFTDPAQENGFQLRGCEESSPGADDGFALDEPFQFKVFKDGVEYEAGALSIAFWGEGEIIPPVFPDATSRFIGDGRQSAIRSIRDFPDIEDPSCDTPIPISCGQSHSGNNTDGTDNALSYNCFTNVVDGPEVIYTFTIDQTEDVLITLDGLSDDLELLLLDECDRDHCIAVSERTGASAETILYEDLEPGDYVIVVEGYIGFQSDYTLSLDCGDFPQGDFNCTPEEIGCNETISATTADGCSDVSFYNCSDSYMPGREKVYRIRFDQPENVRITLTPQGGDLELFLLDALDPNRCIYSSTESGDEIERILLDDNEIIPNRDYYIVVDEFNTNNGVDFQLQVQCVPDGPPCPWCPPPPGFCDNAEAITCGTTINGHTQNGDARVDKWGDCPSFNVGPELIYVFDNPVTQDVQVTLSGFTENLNFYILRDQCAVSACYEGWAGNKSGLITESILITPMPAGQYYIVVDSYDAASAFALEVKCQETDNCFELDVPAGYSYISSNRRPGDPTIENVLPSGQFQGLSLILSDEWGNIYDPNFPTPGAPNRIENWATTDGYRIDVSEPVTLEFCGEEAEPEASRAVIAQTATGEIQNNIIGYPFQGPMTVEETFAGSPTEGLSSIEYRYPNGSQASESYIFPLQLGTNFTMAPGNGYLLKVSQDGEFSFRSQEEASTFMPNGCTYFRTPLRNTMERAFIRVPISGVSGTMEVGDELGLFNEDGLLCGSGKYLGGQIIITLLGDENATAALEGFVPGEMMYAQIWSATTGKVKEVGLQFSESEAVYAHNQIYRLDDLSSTTRTQNHAALIWQLYPNPAGERLYLEYQLPDAQMISVRLIATNGQVKVQYEWNLESGVNRTSIDLRQLPNGIYFVQLATDGATETKKIVVQH